MSVNSEVADDSGEEATSGEIEERIEDFKQGKARQKLSFILYSLRTEKKGKKSSKRWTNWN